MKSSVSYTLSAGVENLLLTSAADINATGNNLNNVIRGGIGDNVLDGKAGTDQMSGGLGNDTYFVDDINDKVIEQVEQGHDKVFSSVDFTLSANVEDLTLIGLARSAVGNSLDNQLIGNDSDNQIFGEAGDDKLDGAGGLNWLNGGTGNDTYIVRSANDIVIEASAAGNDRVDLQWANNYSLTSNVENITRSSLGNFTTYGNELNNIIKGGVGNDRLEGLGGDDTLSGGLGVDTLVGGNGNDTYLINDLNDQVIEVSTTVSAGAGISDQVIISNVVAYTLPTNVENGTLLTAGELTGNSLVNELRGSLGADSLTGVGGNDSLYGGEGDDQYFVSFAGWRVDSVIELANGGFDTVYTSQSVYGAFKNVERLQALGSGNLTMWGDETTEEIRGNSGDNFIYGAAADLLLGFGGNDHIWGSGTIDGGLGNDTLYLENVSAGVDVVEGGEGNDTIKIYYGVDNGLHVIRGGKGNDTILSDEVWDGQDPDAADANARGQNRFEYALGDGMDTLSLVDIEGDDVIRFVDLKASQLTFAMTDSYSRLQIIVASDQANSGIKLNSGSRWLLDHSGELSGSIRYYFPKIEVLNESGRGYASLGTSELRQLLLPSNEISGTNGADVLVGNTGNDMIYGLDGDDTLYGRGGNDQIFGGSGNDNLYAGVALDHWRGAGNSILDGGPGNDFMHRSFATGGNIQKGGLGDDTFELGPNDVAIELPNEGTDFAYVYAYGTVYLPQNIENAALMTTGKLVGTAGNNVLTAHQGIVVGGKGNDTLIGDQNYGRWSYGYDTSWIYPGGAYGGVDGEIEFQYSLGDGTDQITSKSHGYNIGGNTIAGDDKLRFMDISSDRLWFKHVANDLQISILGTTDSVTIKDWYSNQPMWEGFWNMSAGEQARWNNGSVKRDTHIQQIIRSNGDILLDTQVEVLVQAMAGFSNVPSVQSYSSLFSSSMNTTLANLWQPESVLFPPPPPEDPNQIWWD